MKISDKHKRFADEYIKHGDATKAYQLAYPKTSEETARPQSYRILQNVTVQAYIKKITDKINEKAENMLVDELSERQYTNLLTTFEKRHILSQIARGELEISQTKVSMGIAIDIILKPDYIARIKALELENRMTGDHNDKIEGSIIDKDGNIIFDISFGNKI